MPQPVHSGNEIVIASAPHLRQENARITALNDGGFIAVWQRHGHGSQGADLRSIQAQVYNADGSRRGSEFTVSNPYDWDIVGPDEVLFSHPDVTVLDNGQVIIAWEQKVSYAHEGDRGLSDVLYRSYNPSTGALGLASSGTVFGENIFDNARPKVTGIAHNRFAITFHNTETSWGNTSDAYQALNTFNETGTHEVFYSMFTGSWPNNNFNIESTDIASLRNGGLVQVSVVPIPSGDDTSGYSLMAWVTSPYRPDYPPYYELPYWWETQTEVTIATEFTGDQHDAAVIGLSNGNFAVIWTHEDAATGDGSGSSVKARVFTNTGAALTGEIIVSTTTAGNQSKPVIEALNDGGFVVAFESTNAENDQDVRVVTFDAAGNRRGDDLIGTGRTAGDQIDPSLAVLRDGRFALSWTDEALGVRTQIFDPNPLIGGDGDDILDGTTVKGPIDGRGGKDTVTYEASDGPIAILVGAPVFNQGHAAGDTYRNVEAFVGTKFSDEIYGDAQAQEFRGGRGNDTLDGGAGTDKVIFTGKRSDYLVAQNADGSFTIADRVANRDGSDTIRKMEIFEFAGREVRLADIFNAAIHDTAAIGDLRLDKNKIDENSTFGTAIGTVTVGGKADSTQRFQLTDSAGGRFSVDADGTLRVANGVRLDYEQGQNHIIEVVATDARGQQVRQSFSIQVDDVLNEVAIGSAQNDLMKGGSGKDTFSGAAGDDTLWGGEGQDMLTGDLGRDIFAFGNKHAGKSKSKADYIIDFSGKSGDRIDLKSIDADAKKKGDQAFSFIGTKAFSKAGEVRYEKIKKDTYVYLNTDSDQAAEAVIKLKGSLALQKSWFVL